MRFSEVCLIFCFGFIPCIVGGMDQIVGGIQDVPLNDPEITRLSHAALAELNKSKHITGSGELVKVISASRQVVSGTLTRLILEVNDLKNTLQCKVKIWEQPWLQRMEITVEECVTVNKEGDDKREVSNQGDLNLQLFNNFLKTHNKVYADEKEYKKRFRIFRANLNKIKLLHKSEQGTAQYGLTWFSDLSANEFKRYLGLKTPDTKDELPPAEIPNIELPNQFDWRNYNVVTPVKNQEYCGSCWAFSVTGNVEGQWALKKGKLFSLSEQELIDCDKVDNGCNGGFMTTAYEAIMKLGGLETESDYPYKSEDEVCHFNKSKVKVQISGAVNISSDEVKMAKWLVKNGPMSVALNAGPMQFYFGGVSHPIKAFCDPDKLDHGVLIVGFGVQHHTLFNRTLPYWIIKNSWGRSWGERGYYRLYRGDGSCGINKTASSAVVD